MNLPDSEVWADGGRLRLPAIIVHGGAGRFDKVDSEDAASRITDGLRSALAAGWRVLESGGDALDAAVAAVSDMEDSGRFNAGRGAVPTSAGTYELDAGVMDGATGRVGAICAAKWPANPIQVARDVAEVGGPPEGPTLLAGEGADHFARQRGHAEMTDEKRGHGTGDTDDAGAPGYDSPSAGSPGPGEVPTGPAPEPGPASEAGTVGAVAVDAAGHVAAATSTGGRSGQLPGRVGDSPIPGAGVWADDETAAASATGAGEAFVVAGFGHRVDWEMRAGRDLPAAMSAALAAVARLGGDGGGIAVAGDGTFVAAFNSRAMARGWRDADGEVARVFPFAESE